MGKLEGVARDLNSGALIFKKKSKGKNIDQRVVRKILLEIYRVLPEESKKQIKRNVRIMLENL